MTISRLDYYGGGTAYRGADALKCASNVNGHEVSPSEAKAILDAHLIRVGRQNARRVGSKFIFSHIPHIGTPHFTVIVLNP